jgi:hypothetical protein
VTSHKTEGGAKSFNNPVVQLVRTEFKLLGRRCGG